MVWAEIDPHIAGNGYLADAGPASAGEWLEWDVTGFVQTSSAVYFGIANQELDVLDLLWLATRESGAANAPHLVVTRGSGGTPALGSSRTDGWYRPGYSSLGNLGSLKKNRTRSTVVTLTNTGTADLTFSGAPTVSGSSIFTVSAPGFPAALAPNASVNITVSLANTGKAALGRHTGTLTVNSAQLPPQVHDLFADITQGRECDPRSIASDFSRVLDEQESTTVGCWAESYVNFLLGAARTTRS